MIPAAGQRSPNLLEVSDKMAEEVFSRIVQKSDKT